MTVVGSEEVVSDVTKGVVSAELVVEEKRGEVNKRGTGTRLGCGSIEA